MAAERPWTIIPLDDAPLDPAARAQVFDRLAQTWGSVMMVTRGELVDLRDFPAVVALRGQEVIGILIYRAVGDACEVLVLESWAPGQGVGSALLDAAAATARAAGCRRLWLITTNDNLHALSFYQRRGFRLVALYPNALDASRRLKPQIPLIGLGGIPLRDELELSMDLA